MRKKRIRWIDVAKGITILLVVLEHISVSYIRRSGNPLVNNNMLFHIIDAIAMPVFFFLSGLFIDHLFKRRFIDILYERFIRLMIPYFIWGIVSILFLGVYTDKFQFLRIIELPIRPIFVLWFVYALFLIDIILYLLNKLFHNKLVVLSLLLIIWVVGILWSMKNNIPVDSFSRIVLGISQGSLLVYLGYIYKYYVHLDTRESINTYFVLLLLCLVALIIIYYINTTNIIVIFIGQILGILLVIYVSKILVNNKLLNHILSNIGLVTMQIYVMHKFIVEILSLIIFKFMPNLFIFSIINLLMTILICIIGIKIIDKMHLSKLIFGTK